MRVTQNMISNNFLANLSKNYKSMNTLMEQASSGKKINRPSDNPVTAVRGMSFRSSLNEIDQFKRNVDSGISWMTATDESLDEVTSVLQRVRELTVSGLNGTNDDGARYAIAQEVQSLKEHLGEVANSQIAGKHIFAGTDVQNAPFSGGVFSNNNTQKVEYQVGQSNNVQINTLGTEIFNKSIDLNGNAVASGGDGGIFKVLDGIVAQFESGSAAASGDDLLKNLDNQIDNILKERAELGARMNRLELSQSRLDGMEISTTRLLSTEEDVDMAEVYTNLKTQENVQQSALSIGARIIQTTLVDFLR